jgi:hypothetical protein
VLTSGRWRGSAELGCDPAHADLAASLASAVLPPAVFGGGLARSVVEGALGLAAQVRSPSPPPLPPPSFPEPSRELLWCISAWSVLA